MNRESNVICASNVYVLNGDFRTDRTFQSMVRGRKSLEAMLKVLSGTGWVPGGVSLDAYTDLLTDLQRDEWKLEMPCSLLGNGKEIVWGVIRYEGGYRVTCRCYRTDCRLFPECRPDFVPGSCLPSLPSYEQTEAEGSARLEEPLPPLYRDLLLPEPEDGPEEVSVEEVLLVEESDIPCLPTEEARASDDGQEAVIRGSADEIMLVLAGPGTGKTHSLINKLEYMVDNARTAEAPNVLLLCFTRAAVREIRDRFQAGVESGRFSDNLSRLDIRTFDSFATLLLSVRGVDFIGLDYDERIQKAIDEIYEDPSILEEMQHFLVDEIQDLVGVRARLVQAILENRPSGCGFTLLGDHLQAIYDYSVKDMGQEPDSEKFRHWLKDNYGDGLKVIRLTKNRRQTARLEVICARLRSMLEGGDAAGAREFMDGIKGLPVEVRYEKVRPRQKVPERVAVLCRTNGQVLLVSGRLRQQNIVHRARTQHTPRLLPAWVVDLVSAREPLVTRTDWADLYTAGGMAPDSDRLFNLFQDLAGTSDSAVDLGRLRRALAWEGRLPDELYEGPISALTVSTIHQAKGREFDRVYVMEPWAGDEGEDLASEARVYYVALTRARNDLKLFRLPFTRMRFKPVNAGGRWMALGRNNSGKDSLAGLEIGMEHDVDQESFIRPGLPDFDPGERQAYIRDKVAPGDPLYIKRLEGDGDRYGMFHENRLIGLMSDRFTAGVREAMNAVYFRSRHIPGSFSEVYVGDVHAVIRKPEALGQDIQEPYLKTGVWYGVYPIGLGRIREW